LHAQSPHVDQFRDVCHDYSSNPHDVCSYCQSFDHHVNCCPYYDVPDEAYARPNAMIETMNKRYKHFVSEMREFHLLFDIDPSLPRLESCIFDNCESSLSLASNVVDNAPLTNLEEVFDLPLTSLSFVAPPSRAHAWTLSLVTRPDLPLPSL